MGILALLVAEAATSNDGGSTAITIGAIGTLLLVVLGALSKFISLNDTRVEKVRVDVDDANKDALADARAGEVRALSERDAANEEADKWMNLYVTTHEKWVLEHQRVIDLEAENTQLRAALIRTQDRNDDTH